MTNRFPADVIAAAQASGRRYGLFPSVTLAQWGLESAYGTRMSGKNNFFGIKAKTGTSVLTHEQNAAGVAHLERAIFADYSSMAEAFDAHGRFLSTTRYAPVRAARTPQDAAKALRACGYATDALYPGKLISIMDANALYQFDRNDILTPADRPPIRRVVPPAPPKTSKSSKAAAGAAIGAGAIVISVAPGGHWLIWAGVTLALVGIAVLATLHFRKK